MAQTKALITDKIEEAGRVLSAANETALRNAISAIQKMLDDVSGADTKSVTVKEALGTLQVLESELSSDEKSQAIRAAILSGMPAYPQCYLYIRSLYDTSVVYSQSIEGEGDADLFRRDYSFTADGTVTLGDPVEVEQRMTYVPVTDGDGVAESNADADNDTDADLVESEIGGDIIPLVERALRADGTIGVKLIAPGWGSKGYYSEALLRREGPKFFPAGTHMYWDHPKESDQSDHPERSLRDLAAQFTTGAVYEENGSDGPGLYARAKPVSTYAPIIEEIAEGIGTSIRILGRAKEGRVEGRTGKVVESFVPLRAGTPASVDFVTAAGAGGKVTQLFESARRGAAENPPAPEAEKPRGAQAMETEWDAKALQEAQRLQAEEITQLKESLARANEREMLREAEDVIRRELGRAELHDLLKARLAFDLVKHLPLTESGSVDQDKLVEQVHEAVKREAALFTAVTGGGRIRGMGSDGEMGYAEDQVKAVQTRLEESFKRGGMSPEMAAIAAQGRR